MNRFLTTIPARIDLPPEAIPRKMRDLGALSDKRQVQEVRDDALGRHLYPNLLVWIVPIATSLLTEEKVRESKPGHRDIKERRLVEHQAVRPEIHKHARLIHRHRDRGVLLDRARRNGQRRIDRDRQYQGP